MDPSGLRYARVLAGYTAIFLLAVLIAGSPAATKPPPLTDRCDPSRAGAQGAEVLVGTSRHDLLCGFGGSDTLRGLAAPTRWKVEAATTS